MARGKAEGSQAAWQKVAVGRGRVAAGKAENCSVKVWGMRVQARAFRDVHAHVSGVYQQLIV